MPALPWTQLQPIEPDHEYAAMASRLPLKSYTAVPGFLRKTMEIRRQLAQTEGLIAYNPQRRHSSVRMLSPIDYETTTAA